MAGPPLVNNHRYPNFRRSLLPRHKRDKSLLKTSSGASQSSHENQGSNTG